MSLKAPRDKSEGHGRGDSPTNKVVRVTANGDAADRSYEILIGERTLGDLGAVARRALTPAASSAPPARRLAVISNRRVFNLYGAEAVGSLRRADFAVEHWRMGDGERYKSLRTLDRALDFLCAAKLERNDAVVALGGGVVGDLAGFAAAVYLRGVAFVQVPTTLLSQIDSSVGGKTGVNNVWGKNLIGAFHQPRVVLIDTHTHRTLPRRELTAGWCEAIKQGAIGDRQMFDATLEFLTTNPPARGFRRTAAGGDNGGGASSSAEQLIELIGAQCEFKASIVADDEREQVTRLDHRSRKILNFGHTIGHALENVTNYRRFRHGEAIGYGMLAEAEISFRLGIFGRSELELLRRAVHAAGRLPRADDLDQGAILAALRRDKKSVAGHLKWVLLERLGRARIVDGSNIPPRLIRSSMASALRPIP